MKLKKSDKLYKRSEVKEQTDKLFIFTDNCDRTSGSVSIKDSSQYSQRFNKTGLKHPMKTSAIIRGLDNAYPITTQKSYSKAKNIYLGNWKDEDFKEFKKVIDKDIEEIKKACVEKGYKEIIFPPYGILNTDIARITISRTPKLFQYIIDKELELKKFEP